LIKRICIIGCGSIGSLYAAHLAKVAEVWAFVRRPEHADALNNNGLRVSGTHEFHVKLSASHDPSKLPQFDLVAKRLGRGRDHS
jgi:2-dehydropantoate 2-reductase